MPRTDIHHLPKATLTVKSLFSHREYLFAIYLVLIVPTSKSPSHLKLTQTRQCSMSGSRRSLRQWVRLNQWVRRCLVTQTTIRHFSLARPTFTVLVEPPFSRPLGANQSTDSAALCRPLGVVIRVLTDGLTDELS